MIDKFIEDGWIIVDVPNPQVVRECAAMLQNKGSNLLEENCNLQNIHELVTNEDFNKLHSALSEAFWHSEFSLHFGRMFMPILKELIGLDILAQYKPFLRIARPREAKDNIGYHKDTQYGQTPYELAVHVPFVDLDDKSSLRVISGSHKLPERGFPSLKGDNEIIRGSVEHHLGKPYAPKRLILSDDIKTEPLIMKVGQAAVFSPALFHGQEINMGSGTRVSTDLRFVNGRAPVELKMGKVFNGYIPISQSPAEKTAADYYRVQ